MRLRGEMWGYVSVRVARQSARLCAISRQVSPNLTSNLTPNPAISFVLATEVQIQALGLLRKNPATLNIDLMCLGGGGNGRRVDHQENFQKKPHLFSNISEFPNFIHQPSPFSVAILRWVSFSVISPQKSLSLWDVKSKRAIPAPNHSWRIKISPSCFLNPNTPSPSLPQKSPV